MEYLPFGDLSKHMSPGNISEQDARQITRDLLEALALMHEEGFTHRDIKPQVRLIHVSSSRTFIIFLSRNVYFELILEHSEHPCQAENATLAGQVRRFWHNKASGL